MGGRFHTPILPYPLREALAKIAAAAGAAGRRVERFGTSHLLFARIDDSYASALDRASESLSVRYAMDFRRATERYAALGRPEEVAARIREFHEAGVRHVVMDFVGPYEDKERQVEWFAAEVRPLLAGL